jgi:hypothetical protein
MEGESTRKRHGRGGMRHHVAARMTRRPDAAKPTRNAPHARRGPWQVATARSQGQLPDGNQGRSAPPADNRRPIGEIVLAMCDRNHSSRLRRWPRPLQLRWSLDGGAAVLRGSAPPCGHEIFLSQTGHVIGQLPPCNKRGAPVSILIAANKSRPGGSFISPKFAAQNWDSLFLWPESRYHFRCPLAHIPNWYQWNQIFMHYPYPA